ncbi:FHA domain-containing protein [Allobranchiibius sp. CTAmp26]|uniref:FHA domain-containing protein n=1 Tax=Allobranchiibius sp. CTAmp26 TaxID=2815214 RepID=UPI001AA137EF|nr:FHA domain-containing protein [Allobranchiibius sp. CTAmp26]MBO1755684.1 FHA domain-containing protein [Allobranchiibius sp. CTAmp26]
MSHPHDPYRPAESGGTGAARQHFGEQAGADRPPYDDPQGQGRSGTDSAARQHYGEQGGTDRQTRTAQAAPIDWQRTTSPAAPRGWSGPHPFDAPQPREVFVPPAPVTESSIHPPAPALTPAPSLDKQPAPVAFPEPVPSPTPAPAREPAPAPVPTQERAQEPAQEPARAAEPRSPEPPADADDDEALTIGRGRGNSIVLDDMLVSRHHVRITADDDGLVLQDLGSRNGTYVNGHRVDRTALHEGDRLGIGATTFEVRDGWLVSV